jgi:hypothetical protein
MEYTVHKIHVYEVYAHGVHAYEVHAHEVYACEMHARGIHAHEVHAYEGFCEDLARQNTVARLSQLRFRRCRIWFSVIIVVVS